MNLGDKNPTTTFFNISNNNLCFMINYYLLLFGYLFKYIILIQKQRVLVSVNLVAVSHAAHTAHDS